MNPRTRVLITVDELQALLPDSPVLLDVRWTLPKPDGREDFAAGHIPGARYVALDKELAAHTSDDPRQGRHPLPDPQTFEQTVRSWGVGEGTSVVVYDDVAGQAAARAWWMLRWAGHRHVRVLDGGWSAWRDAGLPISTASAPTSASTSTQPGSAPFAIRPGSMPSLTADDAAALANQSAGVLLDARAPERFEGLTEPIDPQAGHIPGALNAPAGGNVSNGYFRSSEELADYYRQAGITQADSAGGSSADAITVGAYCGSGVSASHTVLALASIGVDAALFPGSWSAWSNDPSRPIATGTAANEEVHPPQR